MSDPSLVSLWAGPVNLSQVGGARVPNATEVNLTCTGDGSPSCGDIAESFRDGAGRILPNLLAHYGADPNAMVIAAAFSAGGSVLKRLGESAQDRAQVQAMMLSDATYTASASSPADEGYVLYVIDAVEDSAKLFVSTASASPNKDHGTGIQVQGLIRAEVERRLGRSFSLVEPSSLGVTPAPARAWQLGGAFFLEYPTTPHGEQVTVLAERVWAATLLPWLAGEQLSVWSGTGGKRWVVPGLLVALGLGLLYRSVQSGRG